MPGIFDEKYFNAEVFAKYMETVPRVKQNAMLSAGILRTRTDLAPLLVDQVGGNYISVPMSGRIGGEAQNYDGNTDIDTDNTLGTYLQSMIVVGRANGWTEKDFSFDITGKDFMAEIANQVAEYWDDIDEETLLAIMQGIFAMNDGSGFADAHTLDITEDDEPVVSATTLNNAIQKAAGANKNIFTLAIMHSTVATTLENLQVLTYFKENDENGLQRDVALATWNGRTVILDDDVPVEDGKYTTYVFGREAIDFCDCGAKVPYETSRDPKTNGGEDTLISRQRKLFAPAGISYVNENAENAVSPTLADLQNGAHWAVVKDTTGEQFYDLKAIPIARIISLGE